MPREEFPVAAQEQETEQEALFRRDGSINEAFLGEHFGLGIEEAIQEVTWGSYTGTVAQMLADEKCPVGGMIGTAYREEGLEGVANKFKSLSEMDPRFSVQITPPTIEREAKKKVDTPETPARAQTTEVPKSQKPTSPKTAESRPTSSRQITDKAINAVVVERAQRAAVLDLEKQRLRTAAEKPDAIKAAPKQISSNQKSKEIHIAHEAHVSKVTPPQGKPKQPQAKEKPADRRPTKPAVTQPQVVTANRPHIIEHKTTSRTAAPERQAQTPNLDTPNEAEVLIPEIPELTIEIEQEQSAISIIDSLEIHNPPYALGQEDTVDERTPDLPTADYYTTMPGVEVGNDSVDVLLASLEEGFRFIEVEYAGKLLAGALLDFAETGVPEDDVETDQAAPGQTFEEEFNLYLETLEPAQAEAIQDIIEAISVTAKAIEKFSVDGAAEEQTDILQLEELCTELFKCLGLEYARETIEQFITSITTPETFIKTDGEELSIEILNKRGTYEYKHYGGSSLLDGLTQLIKQKMQRRLSPILHLADIHLHCA